ncbi:lytic murein transglycosylase [Komagataeibacter medellinensis NBRC 3288]|uniref:Lytic murein transglycosylase n=2 Tax=Komagataeibacter medellinensis TaxID=1177712 RepID=G2I0X3_KOMMN|nr:lytic murein transglycosylase [Komagataeibacter medellinensis NBRC 3288]
MPEQGRVISAQFWYLSILEYLLFPAIMRYILRPLKHGIAGLFVVASIAVFSLTTAFCQPSGLSAHPLPADEVAMAVPMLQGQATLLHPLSASDAARLRAAFADQSAGNFDGADALLRQLKDGSLTGSVLAERCLHASHACSTPMLESWLAQYPDLPATPMMRAMLAFRSNPDALVGGNRMAGRTLSATDAQNLYAQGQDRIVLGRALATSAFREASGRVAFYAGLSAWRLGEVPQSQQLFAWAANADRASKDLRSAASWWAGRAAGRAGNTKDAVRWLVQSARCKDCFYGVIARHTLDKNESQNDTAVIAVADVAVVAARPAGHRAMALLQVGRMDLAEAELHNDWANADNINERQSIGLIAHAVENAAGTPYARSSKLVPGHALDLPHRFTPRGGFVVDPALIYGIISIESRFQPTVVSKSGARGLMQLMPLTAANFAGSRLEDLNNPSFNLLIGQRYLMALARDGRINNHLIRLLASYAVGHAMVAHWKASEQSTDEPLAFLEAIPKPRVRNWIETVLLHSWMYSEKLNRRPATLDSLALGEKAKLPLAAETSFQ